MARPMNRGSLPVSGYFLPVEPAVLNKRKDSSSEDEEPDDDDDLQWLDYSQINAVADGGAVLESRKTKIDLVSVKDTTSGNAVLVEGRFMFKDQWWTVNMQCRKTWRIYRPISAPSYGVCSENFALKYRLVPMFLNYLGIPGQHITRFLDKVKEWNADDQLIFDRLLGLVTRLQDELPEDENVSPRSCILAFLLRQLPTLLEYLPQLLPFTAYSLFNREGCPLETLETAMKDEPWIFGFNDVMACRYRLYGCEATLKAFKDAGLLKDMPDVEKNALYIYNHIKKDAKENGHTYIWLNSLRRRLGEDEHIKEFDKCLEFLESNFIIKQEQIGKRAKIYLHYLWRQEQSIAEGIETLIERHQREPWVFDINFDREEFQSIGEDEDQRHAAYLISQRPVLILSGKGGCGKTHVVSRVCDLARSLAPKPHVPVVCKYVKQNGDNHEAEHDCSTGGLGCSSGPILLTAPTGKAANHLGEKAGMAAYTLHQVIFNYRKLKLENKGNTDNWRFNGVRAWIVDEGSMVSVTTFSSLFSLLLEEAQLEKLVILGDYRQLPSIEPGNLFLDLFQSMRMSDIDCSIELKTNHRSESELIVQNATKIAQQKMPHFDPDRHFHFIKGSEYQSGAQENDYSENDTSENVKRLLTTEACLKDHRTSQFVAFRRSDCALVNEVCCMHYNNHTMKTQRRRRIFQVGDKICCKKNAMVNVFLEEEIKLPKKEDVQNKDADEMNTDASAENEEKKTIQMRLCNGEIFFIIGDHTDIDNYGKKTRFITLQKDDKEIRVNFGELKYKCRMEHAWARTIHTYQGSESDTIVYIVGASVIQNWQHVYTAVTRGRKHVYICGQESKMRSAVRRLSDKRRTSLKDKLETLLIDCLNRHIPGNKAPRASQLAQNVGVPMYVPTSPAKRDQSTDNSKSETHAGTRKDVKQNDSVIDHSSINHGSHQQAKAAVSQTNITSIVTLMDLKSVKVSEQCEFETDLETSQNEDGDSQQTLHNCSEGWSDIDENLLTNAADTFDTRVSINEDTRETTPTVPRLNSVISKFETADCIYQPSRACIGDVSSDKHPLPGGNIELSNSEQLMRSPKRMITNSDDVMHTPEKQLRRESNTIEDVSPMRRSLKSLEF